MKSTFFDGSAFCFLLACMIFSGYTDQHSMNLLRSICHSSPPPFLPLAAIDILVSVNINWEQKKKVMVKKAKKGPKLGVEPRTSHTSGTFCSCWGKPEARILPLNYPGLMTTASKHIYLKSIPISQQESANPGQGIRLLKSGS